LVDRDRDKIVAGGTWFYDGSVPHDIANYAKSRALRIVSQ